MNQAKANDRPNIILINLDDADWSLFSDHIMPRFPNIARLASEGMTFTNLHCTTPFCGPSRASLVRGQYAHRTGIRVNDPTDPISLGFSGGYDEFVARGYEQNEFGAWMQNAGYETMFVGKYHHHGYTGRHIPQGWNEFYSYMGAEYFGATMYTTRTNPAGSFSQLAQDEYRASRESSDIRGLIQKHATNSATRNKPFFLYYAPIAPHRPSLSKPLESMVEPRFANWVPNLRMPITPDYNEANVLDKPPHLRLRALTSYHDNLFQHEFRLRARSIKSVDVLVGNMMSMLESLQLDDNTYILFTSDNGYQLGQHRMTNKVDPYNRTTNVPLIVWGPNVQSGFKSDHLLAHIDICPTILQLGQRSIPNLIDGKSIVPLLSNPNLYPVDTFRPPVVIENWASKPVLGQVVPTTYSGLRYHSKMYIEWAVGANEYYDFDEDPYQLENKYDSLTSTHKAALANHLRSMRREKVDPITSIATPLPRVATNGRINASGGAEDDSIVRTVNVVYRSINTGRYFDGKKWTDSWTRIPASTTSNDRQMTYWNHQANLYPETSTGFDYIQLFSFATDDQGNFSRPFSWSVIPLDQVRPTSRITYPSRSINVPAGDFTIVGQASDNFRMKEVRIVIQNRTTGKYWNGSNWQGSWAYVKSNLNLATGRWDYTFRAAADSNFWFSSRAVDQAGNVQSNVDAGAMNTR